MRWRQVSETASVLSYSELLNQAPPTSSFIPVACQSGSEDLSCSRDRSLHFFVKSLTKNVDQYIPDSPVGILAHFQSLRNPLGYSPRSADVGETHNLTGPPNFWQLDLSKRIIFLCYIKSGIYPSRGGGGAALRWHLRLQHLTKRPLILWVRIFVFESVSIN